MRPDFPPHHSMKRSVFVPLAAALALAACTPASPGAGGSSSSASSWSSSASSVVGDVDVSNPLPDQTVASPLVVYGRAKGTWYFEGSFPVKLLDAQGNVLAQAPAQAQGEWMTTDYVPFSAQLPAFTATPGTTGKLVLEKDNPSGLPQNAASVEIPVKF